MRRALAVFAAVLLILGVAGCCHCDDKGACDDGKSAGICWYGNGGNGNGGADGDTILDETTCGTLDCTPSAYQVQLYYGDFHCLSTGTGWVANVPDQILGCSPVLTGGNCTISIESSCIPVAPDLASVCAEGCLSSPSLYWLSGTTMSDSYGCHYDIASSLAQANNDLDAFYGDLNSALTANGCPNIATPPHWVGSNAAPYYMFDPGPTCTTGCGAAPTSRVSGTGMTGAASFTPASYLKLTVTGSTITVPVTGAVSWNTSTKKFLSGQLRTSAFAFLGKSYSTGYAAFETDLPYTQGAGNAFTVSPTQELTAGILGHSIVSGVYVGTSFFAPTESPLRAPTSGAGTITSTGFTFDQSANIAVAGMPGGTLNIQLHLVGTRYR